LVKNLGKNGEEGKKAFEENGKVMGKDFVKRNY
jgi:hypothetical protein